jgi:hypothetical protein
MNDLFPTIVSRAPAPPCKFPFFIAAYWRGGWWRIMDDLYPSPDCPDCVNEIASLQNNGWSHVTVLRLPSELWEGA